MIQRVETMDKQITHHKSVNEKLAHEIAMLKRFKFARRSEQLSPDQASLLDDLIDTDIAAIEAKLEAAATDTRRSQSAPATQARTATTAVSSHTYPSRIGCLHQHAQGLSSIVLAKHSVK